MFKPVVNNLFSGGLLFLCCFALNGKPLAYCDISALTGLSNFAVCTAHPATFVCHYFALRLIMTMSVPFRRFPCIIWKNAIDS